MDRLEECFLTLNKHIEDKLDHVFHIIESRLDKLHRYDGTTAAIGSAHGEPRAVRSFDNPRSVASATTNPFSCRGFITFKTPYIRDFRGFSPPLSEDMRQLEQFTGLDNIDHVVQLKNWTKESEKMLKEAVLEHFAKSHLVKLIKQKNYLLNSPSKQNDEDVYQKLKLIDEQMAQVQARKDPKIFVPEDRLDTNIDWCAISAKLTTQHDARDCRLMWSNRLHWSINDDDNWTEDEDICLINAVDKHGKNSWDRVAKELNSGRLAWQCCARYNQVYAYVASTSNQDEIDKIIEVINLCRIGNYVPWSQVMHLIQSHSLHQVKHQWRKYCAAKKTTSNWTPRESLELICAVRKYGDKDWCRIAACVPGRSNRSCRERYVMRMKFATRAYGKWTKGEDAKLRSLVEMFGTNWSLISSHLGERNCHQLRNRFELIKKNRNNFGSIKRKKLIRLEDGQLVRSSGFKRMKSQSEIERDQRLGEIFSTYLSVNKSSSSKSITCRSAIDEVIYQGLVKVITNRFTDSDRTGPLLEMIINRAIGPKQGLLTPCVPTLRAFRAWSLQQDYLSQFESDGDQEPEPMIDAQLLRVVVDIFLWPAILSRLKRPNIDRAQIDVGNSIKSRSKEFFQMRNLLQEITK